MPNFKNPYRLFDNSLFSSKTLFIQMEFKVISALQEKDVCLIVSQAARTKGRRVGYKTLLDLSKSSLC